MTVYFFTKGKMAAGSSRHRAILMASYLRERGIDGIVQEPLIINSKYSGIAERFCKILGFLKVLIRIKKADVIYLQATLYGSTYLILKFYLMIFSRTIIFDFDDAYYLLPKYGRRVEYLVKKSTAVIAGSHSLAEWAKKLSQHVFIIPTSVPMHKYAAYTADFRSKTFNIGWIGNGPAHINNLKLLLPVFDELNRRGLNFKFTLIGSLGDVRVRDLFEKNSFQTTFIDKLLWSDLESVPKAIQEFDVGVMPLVDTEWNQGKCSFKAIEYMACGVPPIISNVGENSYVVKNGVSGYLVENTKEWVEAIIFLYNNPEAKKTMGKKAQTIIQDNYSLEENSKKLVKIISNITHEN